ncbi:MAG: hypothetical protein ACRDTF_11555 [Pseudonocardiaceae bacterium]
MSAWMGAARTLNHGLYLPALTRVTEVRAVSPDAGPPLAEPLGDPSVVLGPLDAATDAQVNWLFVGARAFKPDREYES